MVCLSGGGITDELWVKFTSSGSVIIEDSLFVSICLDGRNVLPLFVT